MNKEIPKFMEGNCIHKGECEKVSEDCHLNCDKYHRFDLREFIDFLHKNAQVKPSRVIDTRLIDGEFRRQKLREEQPSSCEFYNPSLCGTLCKTPSWYNCKLVEMGRRLVFDSGREEKSSEPFEKVSERILNSYKESNNSLQQLFFACLYEQEFVNINYDDCNKIAEFMIKIIPKEIYGEILEDLTNVEILKRYIFYNDVESEEFLKFSKEDFKKLIKKWQKKLKKIKGKEE